MTDTARIDLWLWQARFFKTRAMAGAFVAAGRVRLIRGGLEVRLDKASRAVRPGDQLVFVLGTRIVDIEVRALPERRGPAAEARTLYAGVSEDP
jgi:ribosomal 50S subunit-recycling heat shock protein